MGRVSRELGRLMEHVSLADPLRFVSIESRVWAVDGWQLTGPLLVSWCQWVLQNQRYGVGIRNGTEPLI